MKRIVHLGVGNFHRAHQAWYTAQGDWKITGVVMSNAALFSDLSRYRGRFALGTWTAEGLSANVIDVYDDVFLVSLQGKEIAERIADPDTYVVTLTITEKGYHLLPSGQSLDLDAPPIARDLQSSRPRSALGLLAQGLSARCASKSGPITVVSCDNLTANGPKLRQALLDFLSITDEAAVDWVKDSVSFPSTMVDRITPRLSDSARNEILSAVGQDDMSAVGTEAFSEWVVEDNFARLRPDWDNAGAIFAATVGPFEERKLRLLNAAHSYLAYGGLLAGHTFVHEAIADATLRAGVESLWDEAQATVSGPALDDIANYRAALLERFAVPAMRHRLGQIAEDGSLKLRERVAPIIEQRRAMGLEAPDTRKAINCWIRFVEESVLAGREIVDTNAARICELVDATDSDARLAELAGLK